jgi:hypothetical protein
MNTETLLVETFTEHEYLAPDAEQVLAGVHAQVGARRTFARPLSIAASVVLVAGAAVGVVVIGNHGGATAGHQPAAGSPKPHVAPHVAPAPTHDVQPLTMPFDLGWLPDGTAHYVARRINIGAAAGSQTPAFDGEYMLTVGPLDIDVQQMPGDLGGVQFKCGSGVDVTVAGRPGVADGNSDGPCGYEVYFDDAAGGVMYVNVSAHPGADVAGSELASVGRRVAANVRFPGSATVQPAFGVGYVPAGLRVRAFDVEDGSGMPTANGAADSQTIYNIGPEGSMEPWIDLGSGGLPAPAGTPGRAVQGHPTRYTDENGYLSLYVLDAVHGQPVRVAGRQPLDELYRIADGLVLPQ